jgi:hypothetical protein
MGQQYALELRLRDGRIAPIRDLLALAPERGGSTQSGRSLSDEILIRRSIGDMMTELHE